MQYHLAKARFQLKKPNNEFIRAKNNNKLHPLYVKVILVGSYIKKEIIISVGRFSTNTQRITFQPDISVDSASPSVCLALLILLPL